MKIRYFSLYIIALMLLVQTNMQAFMTFHYTITNNTDNSIEYLYASFDKNEKYKRLYPAWKMEKDQSKNEIGACCAKKKGGCAAGLFIQKMGEKKDVFLKFPSKFTSCKNAREPKLMVIEDEGDDNFVAKFIISEGDDETTEVVHGQLQ